VSDAAKARAQRVRMRAQANGFTLKAERGRYWLFDADTGRLASPIEGVDLDAVAVVLKAAEGVGVRS
jgi:hypothetical protein